MKIAICVDKSNGILFGGKRLSQDSILRNKLIELAGNGKLCMNEYILRQRLDNLDKDYALLKMQAQELIVRNNKSQLKMSLAA